MRIASRFFVCKILTGFILLFNVALLQAAENLPDAGDIILLEKSDKLDTHINAVKEPLQRTIYLGLGVGKSTLKPNTDEVAGVDVVEKNSSGIQLTVGMDLNDWFSVELHGTDLGEAELSNDSTIGYREYGLSSILYLGGARSRLNRHGWTVFGRTGIGALENSATEGVQYEKNEGLHWILGAGTEYSTKSGFAVRAEGIAYDKDVSYLQLGLLYRIGRSPSWFYGFPGFGAADGYLNAKREKMSGKGVRTPTAGDRDGDGVLGGDDKCPDTPMEIAVGENGCAVFDGAIEGLTFLSASARLTDTAKQVLDSVAESLLQMPEGVRARVSAHTDGSGEAGANMRLSQSRARAVVKYLNEKGVDQSRLESQAFGEAQPIATNGTVNGRRINRRVEIDVITE